jgi:Predicted membrane protein
MLFCPNCGAKLQEGDTFCGSCGAKLNGTSVNTQHNIQHQSITKSSSISSISSFNFASNITQIIFIIFNSLIKPIASTKKYIQTLNQQTILITGAILAIIQGILSLWKLQQIVSLLSKTLQNFASSIGSIFSIVGGTDLGLINDSDISGISSIFGEVKKAFKIPYSSVFFHGIILYLIILGLIILGIYIAAKLFSKNNIIVLNIAKLAILSTIPILGGEFFSIILSYLNFTLGTLALLIGILVTFTSIIINIKEVVEIEEDKLVYALAIIFTLVTACALFTIWKFILSDINSIKNSLINNPLNLLK